MLSVPHLWALWCLDMMSGHDIDSISEDGLSPLTHIADLTHEDYNFIVLKHFTHPGCFPHQPRPFYTFLYLYLWHSHRRHQGEELGLYITIRADENFVDLHCFVEGPKFWKIVPHLFDFLCCVYFDFIGQVRKCRKQIYLCNIVMVGHFTFGLCQRLQSGQRL